MRSISRAAPVADQVAIITGGARGIGHSTARAIGDHGVRLGLQDRDASALETACGATATSGRAKMGKSSLWPSHADRLQVTMGRPRGLRLMCTALPPRVSTARAASDPADHPPAAARRGANRQ